MSESVKINDFHLLLINDESIRKDAFWGKYKLLNTLPSQKQPELNLNKKYFDLQVQKLSQLEQSKSLKYTQANNFLKNLNEQKIKFENINNEIVEMTENQILSRILQILNLGFSGAGENSPVYQKQNNNISKSEDMASKLIQEITQLLQQIKVSQPLSKQIADLLESRFNDYKKMDAETYRQEKANLAEELLSDVISQRLAKTYTTGAWLGPNNKQLIEDNITFLYNIIF